MTDKLPEINFKVDKEFEKKVAMWYYDKKDNFDRFIEDFPELKKALELDREEAEKFLSKRIDEIYRVSENKLIRKKSEIQIGWDKIKDKFLKEASKIFDSHPWPSGNYEAHISVFGMFKFNPGTKSFSIPSHDYSGNPPAFGFINFVTTHEMTHILFEDFFKKHFKKDDLPLQKYYDLLEVSTNITLNQPQITSITKWQNYPYDRHKKYYEDLKEVFKDCESMKEFMSKAIEYLKKE